ncbi:methyltransferase, FxLD system [Streptomyces sp. G44]|uniref:methyltransferase, FxLD system n=1 Tax=Streptomyces sp. G44 TaxID=2807632 RepID=UPI0027DE4153|nr:methyltransferase, FxLD system [Streptomyces sp. G44]
MKETLHLCRNNLGELALYLNEMGYSVDAVDYAESAIELATAQAPDDADVHFLHHDIEHDSFADLPHDEYDLITLRLCYAFLHNRTWLLNRLREHLRPGGTICIITPLADAVPADRRDIALDEGEIVLATAGWATAERFDADGMVVLMLREPAAGPVSFADKRRPTPQGLIGAGVVVTDEQGRVLLGRSVRGVWELPGGKPTPSESFEQAAVRELAEETGLEASVDNAQVLAFLMDTTYDIPRLTAAVRITAHHGTPTVTEPDLFHRWEWHWPADLPALTGTLFTPSAHVLDCVWPGLLEGLPPVHRNRALQPAPHEDPVQARESHRLRQEMTDHLIEQGYINDASIEAAFRRVRRHLFLPGVPLKTVYAAADAAVTTKCDGSGRPTSTVSAPWLQAVMLREAALGAGQTALEIGSNGPNAALMQECVGPEGRVTTMDIDPFVVERSARLLPAAGYDRVRVVLGDGEHGAPGLTDEGSLDAILVTVQALDIPSAWVTPLVEGGRLVVPLRIHGYSWAVAFEKRGNELVSRAYAVCGFVPMQGAGARAEDVVVLRGGEIRLRFPEGGTADVEQLTQALEAPRLERRTGVTLPGNTPFDKLMLWLATTMDGFCRLAVDPNLDTGLVERPKGWDAAAVIRDGSLVRLLLQQTGTSTWEWVIHAYGPAAEQLAEEMTQQVTIWDRDHHIRDAPRLTIRSRLEGDTEPTGARTLVKQHTRLDFDWTRPIRTSL